MLLSFTIAIRAARMQAEDSLYIAIEALKNLGINTFLKATMVWIKSHPWETAALIVPTLLTMCTPAFLGLAGFTTGGIAAGSTAAGFQAGIGNFAAGSIFATLTSAVISGYGVPIIFGSVWSISSVVCWGLATWKKRKQDSDYVDGAGHDKNHSDFEGTEDTKSRLRLL
ncbi:hypothetical protein COCMIDRAFT_110973 [Bipolaris oryzae ATCC 44560]|uniref:Uncharacterized protein n=1 Tax=Bipolaris oryzae ATCC 44560 TaxID=930090 RepID=W6YVU9_COCMI|nr:uncharacterized protein COCMIDRAFT_110973 [Bipolaris oryzae ATCC 44560]EUC39644.1 hypothetical protein COCMIDRAFT_110973 [Bipolaris oryzae ATCC 44560]